MGRRAAVERSIAELIEDSRICGLGRLSSFAMRDLPEGWRLYLAVGWGVRLVDGAGKTQAESGPLGDSMAARLPRGVRGLFLAACDFTDAFGHGNEVFTREGMRYLP